jgi:hypothetical protein
MRRLAWALIGLSLAAVTLGAPAFAFADGYVAPFVGGNFANNSGNGRMNVGFDAGWMGAGIAGLEFDLGYAPNFFGSAGDFGENNVLTAMGNLIVGIPVGGTHGTGLRPYLTVGGGLVRTEVNGHPAPGFIPKISDGNAGLNGGVGVMGFLSDHVGLRGDVRYFRDFRESPPETVQLGAFHFWRASFGLVFRP